MWWVVFPKTFEGTNLSYVIRLVVNTEEGLSRLPKGRFEMAAEARKGIPGTAEPVSIYPDDNLVYLLGPIGCFGGVPDPFEINPTMCAVPGKGFVDITDEGDGDYSIEFSYEMPNGKTVSGSYTGLVANIASDPDD